MAGNEVTLTFSGDATALERAAQRAAAAAEQVSAEATQSADEMSAAAQQTGRYETSISSLANVASGMSDALGDAGGTLTAIADVTDFAEERARQHARALAAVEQASLDLDQAYGDLRQAQLDLNQSMLDAKQAGIDAEQAQIDARQAALDAAEAQKAYNEAVKQYGAGSSEAKQAQIDLAQAGADLKQANLDAEQSQADLKQAQEDGGQAARDVSQAQRDAKDSAMDLADAQREAHPPELRQWASALEAVTPLVMGLVGVTNLLALAHQGLSIAMLKSAAATAWARAATIASTVATGIATAAQWLWNAAMMAFPVFLIVAAIAAVVAAIVWVATQTTWFQTVWQAIWGAIVAYINWVKDNYLAAFRAIVAGANWIIDRITSIPGMIKNAFAGIASIILAPFRAGFNAISDAWNATIGQLRWTVPGWVPGVGGNSVSAPRLPKYHTGGVVPGPAGAEVPIMALAGETILPPGASSASGGSGRVVAEVRGEGAMADLIRALIRRGELALYWHDDGTVRV